MQALFSSLSKKMYLTARNGLIMLVLSANALADCACELQPNAYPDRASFMVAAVEKYDLVFTGFFVEKACASPDYCFSKFADVQLLKAPQKMRQSQLKDSNYAVFVVSSVIDTDCEFDFKERYREYIVFAQSVKKGYVSNNCGHTALLTELQLQEVKDAILTAKTNALSNKDKSADMYAPEIK